MEQTIKNMELIIKKLNKELNDKNYSACKTMMNTYGTLLNRFSTLSHDHEKSLAAQNENLIRLFGKIETLTYMSLREQSYKVSNVLAETSRRIENSSNIIQGLMDYAKAERKRKFNIMLSNLKKN